MGRPRGFDTEEVLARATVLFIAGGYAGTSIDELVNATGLQRASLYNAFGSKRGVFLAALRRGTERQEKDRLDLLLVALMDLAPRDVEVRRLMEEQLAIFGSSTATLLGTRLLERALLLQPLEPEGHS